MPELRKNVLTDEWVIIATERAKRPQDFQKKRARTIPGEQERVATRPASPPGEAVGAGNCPFCPGNEAMTPPEVFAFREEGTSRDKPGWRVRVVPNKFPAQEIHEVIIETPSHQKSIATLSPSEMEEVILTYQQRYLAAEKNEKIKQITIFRNHGETTGASKLHPHTQLIATPVSSQKFRNQERVAVDYWQKEKKCLYCSLLKEELEKKERIISETQNFVLFAPYASQTPFEVWIFPKRHQPCFANISGEEIKDLSEILPKILFKFYSQLGNPDYNYVIQSYLSSTSHSQAKHWFFQILPRLTPIGGYELGSGIFINIVKPEEAAEFLREVI
ncbi:MAG: DUF4931 domain-containing protein [Candidatus Omnitrophica bacterium]|nr:DUF4931 domain-containing protein [Candidatus Omnitrophota bacterium]